MATTVNLADPGSTTDAPLRTPNRSNNGTPKASLTPEFVGEIVYDSANDIYYQASGSTNADWQRIERNI